MLPATGAGTLASYTYDPLDRLLLADDGRDQRGGEDHDGGSWALFDFASLITWVANAALLLASFDPPVDVYTFLHQATAGFLWFMPWALILSLPAMGATAWALRTPQGVELAQRIATGAAILGIWWAILALAGLATIFANQGYGPEVIVGALLAGAGVGAGFGLLLPPRGWGDRWRRLAILGMAVGLGLVVALGLPIPQR